MLKNENMFKNVYFISFKENAVLNGALIQTVINEAGYIVHTIAAKNTFYSVDDAIVFDNLAEAQAALVKYKPINDEIIRLMKDTNKKIDELRDRINGKPHFPEYSKLIKSIKG